MYAQRAKHSTFRLKLRHEQLASWLRLRDQKHEPAKPRGEMMLPGRRHHHVANASEICTCTFISIRKFHLLTLAAAQSVLMSRGHIFRSSVSLIARFPHHQHQRTIEKSANYSDTWRAAELSWGRVSASHYQSGCYLVRADRATEGNHVFNFKFHTSQTFG